jgi:hypothetical protein
MTAAPRDGRGMFNWKAAKERAKALAPIVRELHEAGFVTLQAMAEELNKRNIKSARGGRWHPQAVANLLARLRGAREAALAASREGRSVVQRAADQRAQAVAPIVQELRAGGVATLQAMADALNDRHVKTARGGRWHPASVLSLLSRLGWAQEPMA